MKALTAASGERATDRLCPPDPRAFDLASLQGILAEANQAIGRLSNAAFGGMEVAFIRLRAVSLWRDIGLAFGAPFRKTIEAIDGRIMYSADEVELYLRRSRKLGFIEEPGVEVPYCDFEDGDIRMISADLVVMLRGD